MRPFSERFLLLLDLFIPPAYSSAPFHFCQSPSYEVVMFLHMLPVARSRVHPSAVFSHVFTHVSSMSSVALSPAALSTLPTPLSFMPDSLVRPCSLCNRRQCHVFRSCSPALSFPIRTYMFSQLKMPRFPSDFARPRHFPPPRAINKLYSH